MRYLFTILTFSLLQSCIAKNSYDLAIENARIFDVYNGTCVTGKTILIKAGTIIEIVDVGSAYKAKRKINANGRLVTPGFIDTHIHLADIIGDYSNTPEEISKDSVISYRKKLADTYLKYGITTVKEVGEPEKWISFSLDWQNNPKPQFPDIFISGSAIISDEERPPYFCHTEVKSVEEATEKVNDYYKLGIKYLKLYWRLRVPEMEVVIRKGKELDMNICAHIDNNVVSIDQALDLGVENFEHLVTITNSVYDPNVYGGAIYNILQANYPGIDSYMPYQLEVIQFVQDDQELCKKRNALIDRLVKENGSFSSTIHLFGSYCNRTYMNSYLSTRTGKDKHDLNELQLQRLNKGFDTLMGYIKAAHDKGLKLRIGTDCTDGGQALLSELLLFYEAGFTIKDILQIATINGAQSMGIDNQYGSITKGKKANLIIFDQDPFDNYRNFLSSKTIIKDGVVFGE